jgi:hypothetical protein
MSWRGTSPTIQVRAARALASRTLWQRTWPTRRHLIRSFPSVTCATIDADEPTEAEHAIEAFDSLASELLAIPVAARKRPAPPPVAKPSEQRLVLQLNAVDGDGDIDLTTADSKKAKTTKRAKAGEKKAKRKLQRARAKTHKKKRTTSGSHKKAPRR